MGFTGYLDTGPVQFDSIDGLRKASLHFLNKTKDHLGSPNILTIVMEGQFADSIIK
jgi:hypothetical protein